MAGQSDGRGRLETYAWYALLACIALVPLAVSKLPFLDGPLTFSAFVYPQNLLLLVGSGVALSLWAAATYLQQTRLQLSRPMWALAALGGWAIVATVAAYEPLRSLLGSSKTSLSLANIAAYLTLAFLATQLIGSRQRMRALTWTVIASSTVVAAIALAQQLLGADLFGLRGAIVEGFMMDRGFSTIGNPDQLGTFLVLPAALSGVLFLFAERRKEQVASASCFAVILLALVATLTRGAWVASLAAALVTLAIWLAGTRPRVGARALVILAVFLAAVAVTFVSTDQSRLVGRFQAAPSTASDGSAASAVDSISSGRLALWRSSLNIAADRPLTGTGPGAYELGWYPNAVNPSSGGGRGTVVEDPHSLMLQILATMGVPGMLAYLAACILALVLGGKTSLAVVRKGMPSGKSLDYLAWFVAACALQVALLVAAVTTPILLYAFLSLAVLLLPSAHPALGATAASTRRLLVTAAAGVLALGLAFAAYPSLPAETALARMLRGGQLEDATDAARSARWNMEVQNGAFSSWTSKVTYALTSKSEDAASEVAGLSAELAQAGVAQPREFFFPSLRAQVLTEASNRLGSSAFAEEAVVAADEALEIMPSSISVRVNKALALSDLQRYDEMVTTLAGYWEKETSSAYPGIVYAQALALAGKAQASETAFAEVTRRFPSDAASIKEAQTQIRRAIQK